MPMPHITYDELTEPVRQSPVTAAIMTAAGLSGHQPVIARRGGGCVIRIGEVTLRVSPSGRFAGYYAPGVDGRACLSVGWLSLALAIAITGHYQDRHRWSDVLAEAGLPAEPASIAEVRAALEQAA